MKRTPLRRKSVKQRAKDLEWAAAREAALDRANYWPECHLWNLPGPCAPAGGESFHVHHRLPRSHGGSNDLSNLIVVCGFHHRHIHEHPADAYDNGWMLRTEVTA